MELTVRDARALPWNSCTLERSWGMHEDVAWAKRASDQIMAPRAYQVLRIDDLESSRICLSQTPSFSAYGRRKIVKNNESASLSAVLPSGMLRSRHSSACL